MLSLIFDKTRKMQPEKEQRKEINIKLRSFMSDPVDEEKFFLGCSEMFIGYYSEKMKLQEIF